MNWAVAESSWIIAGRIVSAKKSYGMFSELTRNRCPILSVQVGVDLVKQIEWSRVTFLDCENFKKKPWEKTNNCPENNSPCLPVASATRDFWPPDNCWIRRPSSTLELNDTWKSPSTIRGKERERVAEQNYPDRHAGIIVDRAVLSFISFLDIFLILAWNEGSDRAMS